MNKRIVGVKFYSDTTYYYTTDIDNLKKLDCVVVQGNNTITMVVVVEPNVTHKESRNKNMEYIIKVFENNPLEILNNLKERQRVFRNVIAKLSFSNSIMDIAAKANECKLLKDIFTNLVIVKTETNMHSKTCSLKNIKKTIEKLEKHYEQH